MPDLLGASNLTSNARRITTTKKSPAQLLMAARLDNSSPGFDSVGSSEADSRTAPRRIGVVCVRAEAGIMRAHDLTVYHDGSCPLCRLEVGHYRRQPGAERIAFIDISDPCSHPEDGLSREDAMRRFHVRLSNGELKSGAAAFVEIWKVLPRWRPVSKVAQLPGMIAALDVGYMLISPVRPVLAKMVGRLGIF